VFIEIENRIRRNKKKWEKRNRIGRRCYPTTPHHPHYPNNSFPSEVLSLRREVNIGNPSEQKVLDWNAAKYQ
jgi:hypothetical protein